MLRKYVPLLLLCVLVLAIAGVATAQDSLRQTARSFIAETYGVPKEDLGFVYEHTTMIPGIGEVTRYKMAVGGSDAVYGAVLDGSGQAWTPDEFRVLADEAYIQQYGKMDIQLYSRFEAEPGAVIPVSIWLVVDDALYADLRGPDFVGAGLQGQQPEQTADPDKIFPGATQAEAFPDDSALEAARAVVAAEVESVQARVAGRLAEKGIAVVAVPQTPLVTATLGRDQVVEVGLDPEVSKIFADDAEYQDMNQSAGAAQRFPAVWARGFQGDGAKVALLEDSRAYSNYWLYNYTDAKDWGDPNVDGHATRTMGNIGSFHGSILGMAVDASLYSANAGSYSNSDLQSAAFWAVNQGVHVINNSWGPTYPSGCLDTMGMFFDYRVVNDAVLVTHAAGNSGNLMADQAMAFSILSVGAIDDRQNASWGDDFVDSYSAWKEGTNCSPSNGDREEPDVVAVGSRIRSTRYPVPPYIDGTNQQGTSYSAPMVAGEAALLLDIDSNLAWKPEAMRAIIMASAANNVEGSARLSEYDGAGAIDAYSAYLEVWNGLWSQQTIYPPSWDHTDIAVYVTAGSPISCVAAWDSHPNSSYTSDPLQSDIDLRLINPAGNTVAYSTSSYNSFEIVRWTPGMSGTWICRAYKYSSSASYEFLGMAFDYAFQYQYNYPSN